MLVLAAAGGAAAQGPVTRRSLEKAVSLAARANPTVRERQAVGANEITSLEN